MLNQFEARTRQQLTVKKVPENRRDMRRFADLVHHANFSGQEEFDARGSVIHIGCRHHSDSAGFEQAADVAKERAKRGKEQTLKNE